MNKWSITAILALIGLSTTKSVSGATMNYRSITTIWYDKALRYANRYNLPVQLILAVIKQESNGMAGAKGATSDYGLMQITQGALTDFNIANSTEYVLTDLYDAETNIFVGSWYLFKMYKVTGEYKSALQAYNAGLGAWRKNPNVSIEYANSVLNHQREIASVMLSENRSFNV